MRKRINWDRQPLGRVSDCQLAVTLGVNQSTVWHQRHKRNIPPLNPKCASGPNESSNIDWDKQLLGKVKDSVLAAELNISVAAVGQARRNRNISCYSEVAQVLEEVESGIEVSGAAPTPVVTSTKDFEVTIRIRNNQLKRRRLELGYNTLADFAGVVGISITSYCAFETMRLQPKKRNGEWRDAALLLAKFHGCGIEELFPPAVTKAKSRSLVFHVDDKELMPLLAANQEPVMLPDEAISKKELKGQVKKILRTLTPREEKVLRLRFGIDEKSDYTLEEVGQDFEVTRERIRGIEARALRKLRLPARSDQVREFWED